MAKKSRASTRGKPVQPQRVAAPVAPEDEEYVQQQEAAREKVVAEDANREWNGVLLQPWTEGRSRLLDALCAIDVPLPDPDVGLTAFVHGMLPWSVKVLYLLHHKPEDFERSRSRLLTVIEDWGVKNVAPTGAIEDKMEALQFATKVVNAHQKVMALHRPQRRGPGGESGN